VRAVFADTSYWIAVSNPQDALHGRVKELSLALQPMRVLTSEMVLAEFLNDYSGRGEFLRRVAVRLVERSRRAANVIIVRQTSRQFWEAVSMYATRADKAWSLTDCASFQTMKRYRLTEAFTHDRHFLQAGFRALPDDDAGG
jgi:predicted nucleic acid-binding protein